MEVSAQLQSPSALTSGKGPLALTECETNLNMELTYFPNTREFMRLSGISKLGCATTKTDTAERSISIGRESLQVFLCTRRHGVLADFTARGQS
jgi:hypothetical protein